MKPLLLRGSLVSARSDRSSEVHVVRLVDASIKRSGDDKCEAALVRNPAESRSAIDACFKKIVSVGDAVDAVYCVGVELFVVGEDFSHLRFGDVVALHAAQQKLRILYQYEAKHTWFLTTEQCNNYCLMCSQPPKRGDDSWLLMEISRALPLLPANVPSIGLTGGEPLLLGDKLFSLLHEVTALHPHTAVHVLSNGREFSNQSTVQKWALVGNKLLSIGIPLYSAVDYIHDHVVQAQGAFDQTVMGIMRLANLGQRVEIRLVLQKYTVERLVETCKWIARNLPFVDHVALMGLENTGFAIANEDVIWIDPVDYSDVLRRSVEILDFAGLKVSIFNLPLCVLDETIRAFAVRSISEWKNDFLPVCTSCASKDQCAGFFSTGRLRFSKGIAPIDRIFA